MAAFPKVTTWVFFFLTIATALSLSHNAEGNNVKSSTLVPPTKDPFYTAPIGYHNAAPGTILRLRHAPGNLTTVVANCSAAYHVLYRTTDSRYKPSYAITTVYVPRKPTRKALLSLQVPYNTPDVDHSPSYDVYFGPPADLESALSLGWHVNLPDHQGPIGAGGLGVGQAHATLDSVRAALAMDIGLHHDVRYALWGYSGGAFASEWTAELQASYAPELHFSGMALGGMPVNVSSVWNVTNKSKYTGMMPLFSTILTKVYLEAYSYLVSQLKVDGPHNKTGFLEVLHMNAFEAFAYFAEQDIWDYFLNGSAVLDAPILRHLVDNTLYLGYHGIPQMPILMYHAVHDEAALIELADNLRERYCRVHTDILLQKNLVGNHIEEMTNGAPTALEWLGSVFDGRNYVGSGCTVREVSVSRDI